MDATAPATRQVQAKEGPAFLKAMAEFMKQGGAAGTSLPPPPPAPASGKGKAKGMSYKDAGVDIDAGNSLVERIKPACKSTRRAGCDSDLGGFGGLFDLVAAGYEGKDTILVGATDGVGTKLKVKYGAEAKRGGDADGGRGGGWGGGTVKNSWWIVFKRGVCRCCGSVFFGSAQLARTCCICLCVCVFLRTPP